MRSPIKRWEWALLAAITVGAAALRLVSLQKVSPDPFYDAAVRSMGMSLHNFFFGAFEPGGSVSIDKPPVDLWLQVASVKLLGFSSTTLKLPEAFAGIVTVPMLFLVVRRLWSPVAGLAAAVALAVLPVEVITSRSDTMDAVMMALIVLALLLLVRALETDRDRWLIAAAAVLGVAFDVKLLESLVAVPGLLVLAFLGLRGTLKRRLLRLTAAGAVYVAIALAWLTATLLVPASERPWAIGSTNGSAWNAAFVFNGTDRLGGKSAEPQFTVYEPGHRYPTATQSERDHIPIVPASPTRLLARIGPLSGERLGLELLAALLLGIPALLWGLRGEAIEDAPAPREEGATEGGGGGAGGRGNGSTRRARIPAAARAGAAAGAPAVAGATAGGAVAGTSGPARTDDASGHDGAGAVRSRPVAGPQGAHTLDDVRRLRRATAAGLGAWMLCGIVLFSHMSRLHPRYVESFVPAVAAMLGIGLAWAAAPRGRVRLAVLAVTLAAAVYYSERLLYGTPGTWWVALLAALGGLALALLARAVGATARAGRLPVPLWTLAPAGVIALALTAVLAVPLKADLTAIRDGVTDAGYVGALPSEEQHLVSSYLRAHQGSAYYEVAAESATGIGSLIVQDGRPVLVLTTYNGRVFTTVPELQRQIAAGRVRYAFLNTYCSHHAAALNPACSAPVKWVRAHGTDVSRSAGLRQGKVLYLLPGAQP